MRPGFSGPACSWDLRPGRGEAVPGCIRGLEVGQEPDGLQSHFQVGLGVGAYPGDLGTVGAAEPVPVAAVLGDPEGGPGLDALLAGFPGGFHGADDGGCHRGSAGVEAQVFLLGQVAEGHDGYGSGQGPFLEPPAAVEFELEPDVGEVSVLVLRDFLGLAEGLVCGLEFCLVGQFDGLGPEAVQNEVRGIVLLPEGLLLTDAFAPGGVPLGEGLPDDGGQELIVLLGEPVEGAVGAQLPELELVLEVIDGLAGPLVVEAVMLGALG